MRLFNAILVLAALALVAVPAFSATINEIRIDQSGTDYDEYFELAGMPGESLDGLTYIVIGDGTPGFGTIECAVSLDGYTIAADGYFLAVETSYTGACGDAADGVFGTTLNFENSDNVTHMLVSGFTGATNDDIDTDNDGVIDNPLWSNIVDSVSVLISETSGDAYYSDNIVGPDGSYAPGHVVVCGGEWLIGGFDFCTNDSPGEDNYDSCVVPDESTSFGTLKSLFR